VHSFRLRFSVGKESVVTSKIRGRDSADFAERSYYLLVVDPQLQDLSVALEYSEVLVPRKQIDSAWVHLDRLEPRTDNAEHVSFGCDGERRAEFKLSWFPFNRGSPHEQRAPLPDDVARMGAVFIKLMRCERLTPMDMNGTSDPYVVFRVGCRSKQSSVKRHTLNPVRWPSPS
jgi:hypothetical protein